MSGVYIELAREVAARLRAAARDTHSSRVARPVEQPPRVARVIAVR